MFKKMSPRDMKRMMSRIGLNVEELADVERVDIVLPDKRLVIENPQVSIFKVEGQGIYQVIGDAVEKTKEEAAPATEDVSISEEDVQLVASQAGVTHEQARVALRSTKGDLAEAILLLKNM